jgi:hypothetical protein
MKLVWTIFATALLLACGDKAQTLGTPAQDTSPVTGTGKAYTVGGWKQGDKASWEAQLKARAQYGQNDYSRVE